MFEAISIGEMQFKVKAAAAVPVVAVTLKTPRTRLYNRDLSMNMLAARIMTLDQESKLLTRITSDPAKCGGQACIRGMRIRVVDVLEMLAHKVPEAEILADFPDLESADIQASRLVFCTRFAARRSAHARLVA